MNRIVGRTVLITGATAGIGEACARELAGRGARLVILGRRKERLFELAEALMKEHDVEVQARVVDVTDRAAVEALREDLADLDFSPDVIVNNAGKALGFHRTWEADPADWDEMIDTNLKGLLYVTRAFLPGMVERNRGHVVNIGSTAGRWAYPKGNVYAATKFAVRGLSEGINMDLAGTKVRVSSIDPGLVETEFSEVRFHGDRERAEKVYQGYTPLTPGDIADIVAYVINAPEHVDIFNVVVMPTDQRHSLIVHKEEEGG